MHRKFIHFIFLGIMLLFVTAGYAQLKLSVQVDEKRISTEDYLHIQYTIEHAKKVNKFIPPSFTGFNVIQGPDYTNGWTLINGEMNEYIAIGFVLRPIKKGKFIIQPASANADGQKLRSGTVAIEVTEAGNNTNLQIDKQPGNQPLNDMILKNGENVKEKIKNNLFIRLETNKTNVYVGEPIVAVYKLYTRLNSESKVTHRPSFSGFSVFDMADPESEQAQYEKLNGREYNVYILRKVQLFPLQEGKYELETIQVDNTVSFIKESFARNQNTLNDILSAFGEDGIGPAAWVKEEVSVSSDPKIITVKPLPIGIQPYGYSGAVGEFTIRAELDEKELSVGDVANLNLIISGSGNLPVIGIPEVLWPDGIETFEPESKEELNKAVSPITGKKVFTIPFSPTKAGRFLIPSVKLVVFNPASGKYSESVADSIPIQVLAASSVKDKTGKTVNSVPAFKSTDKSLFPWSVILISIILISSIVFYLFLTRRKEKNLRITNSHVDANAKTEVPVDPPVLQLKLFPHIYNLINVKELIYLGKTSEAYKEIEQVIVSVLSERYDINRGETFDHIYAGLVRRFIPEEIAKQTVSLLQDCQVAQFSPLTEEKLAMADFERAQVILDKLQNSSV